MENQQHNYFYSFFAISGLSIILAGANYFYKDYLPTRQQPKQADLIPTAKAMLISPIAKIPGQCSWTKEVQDILDYAELIPNTHLMENSGSVTNIEQLDAANAIESLFTGSSDFLEDLSKFTQRNTAAIISNQLLYDTINDLNNYIYTLVIETLGKDYQPNLLSDLKETADLTNSLLQSISFEEL